MATSRSEPVPPEVIALAVGMAVALAVAEPAAASLPPRTTADRWKWAELDADVGRLGAPSWR